MICTNETFTFNLLELNKGEPYIFRSILFERRRFIDRVMNTDDEFVKNIVNSPFFDIGGFLSVLKVTYNLKIDAFPCFSQKTVVDQGVAGFRRGFSVYTCFRYTSKFEYPIREGGSSDDVVGRGMAFNHSICFSPFSINMEPSAFSDFEVCLMGVNENDPKVRRRIRKGLIKYVKFFGLEDVLRSHDNLLDYVNDIIK